MRWEGEQESSNVEDRRGAGRGFGIPGGARTGGIGIGTLVIALLGAWLFGVNPLTVIEMLSGGDPVVVEQSQTRSPAPTGTPGSGAGAADDPERRFVAVVLASTEQVWNDVFARNGNRYPAPKLVLYTGMTPTACGTGSSAAGPFYCPADQRVYIDLAFNKVLADRLGAVGKTAQAYVIAHEVGHHVQNITGRMDRVQAARSRGGEAEANDQSVRLELQADCFAGIWARRSEQARQWFDPGDIEQAMQAAAAVGDDHIQRSTRGVVVPESFTHG
jgi:predicted metalloprotease